MRRGAGIIVFLCAACNEAAPAPVAATPERQFVFDHLQIQERKGGKLTWTGTARRAAGDLSQADAEEVHLQCESQENGGKTYQVFAPKAHLALDLGRADFEAVRIVDAGGVSLEAGVAHYDEAAGLLSADGPLTLTAHGLVAHATSARLRLDTGEVSIVGPVTGRYLRPPASAVPAP
ncbi:MAG: hypothetical protein HY903_20220 [Deltaproteobacteria bacterium]|nr:hypothetical protein [Deltaproteobacteria bacterium]